jgi:hypothetical protein
MYWVLKLRNGTDKQREETTAEMISREIEYGEKTFNFEFNMQYYAWLIVLAFVSSLRRVKILTNIRFLCLSYSQ